MKLDLRDHKTTQLFLFFLQSENLSHALYIHMLHILSELRTIRVVKVISARSPG